MSSELRMKNRIYYICDGKRCEMVECPMKEILNIKVIRIYADNELISYINPDCFRTARSKYALNGPIKGPIDLIKRFELKFKPYIHLIEKYNLGEDEHGTTREI